MAPGRTAILHIKKLWEILPKSGMNYPERNRVLHRSKRDKQVCAALKEAGYELSVAGLCQVFTLMFQIATPVFIDARAKRQDLWDMLPIVQQQLD
ncbi:hypothetical protein F4679DRAFT_581169 [Xylaria curta]|nr:hypothetical protein F4679DRAFT_581169 [Xylaria curta]